MARILVVDDQPDVARAIARMLSSYETATESDARRAVARIVGGEQFDMVIVDYDMPYMTGREVSDALLDAELAQPPIVLIMSGSENVASLFATGRGVLIKPFNGNELREVVSTILHEDDELSHNHPRCAS
jgi:CheY-like chemotaxis protein